MEYIGTGLEKLTVMRNNRSMAFGYTTGSCAAAAAKGACGILFSGRAPEVIELVTPKGIGLRLIPELCAMEGETAVCCIRKDSGDDPDVTDGVLVYARVRKTGGTEIVVDGGTGVGRVTRPGLDQPVGAAAINRVPRRMIREAAEEVCGDWEYAGGLLIEISIPAGVEIAKKTFNPRLGITGGISVLGTSGIVEPMSEKALMDSIRAEMRMRAAEGQKILLVSPGNYGVDYIREHLKVDLAQAVKCGNFVGETVDAAVEMGFEGVIFVSHIGKFVKVAGGIMNTHSREADCRMEILAAHSVRAGASLDTVKRVLDSAATDEALDAIEAAGIRESVMVSLMEKIQAALSRRAYGRIPIAALVFSRDRGELGRTENFDGLYRSAFPECARKYGSA